MVVKCGSSGLGIGKHYIHSGYMVLGCITPYGVRSFFNYKNSRKKADSLVFSIIAYLRPSSRVKVSLLVEGTPFREGFLFLGRVFLLELTRLDAPSCSQFDSEYIYSGSGSFRLIS